MRVIAANHGTREPQFRSITRLFNDSERVDFLYAASSQRGTERRVGLREIYGRPR
jgi:hypothetical protein